MKKKKIAGVVLSAVTALCFTACGGFSAEDPAAVTVPLSSSAVELEEAPDAELSLPALSDVDPAELPDVLPEPEFPPHPASIPVATIAVITNAIIFLFIFFLLFPFIFLV